MESLGSGEGLGVLGGATFCGHGYRVWVCVVVWWCCLWGRLVGLLGVGCVCGL